MSAITNPQKLILERRSNLYVILVTLAALLVGWGVKTSTENRARQIERAGVKAQLPAGWILQDGIGDLIFTAQDPFSNQRYSVSLLPNSNDKSLADLAAERSAVRAQLLDTYRVLEETPVTLNGRDGYKVTFAFVDDPGPGSVPTVVKGVDYYFQEQTGVLSVSFQSPIDSFDDALPQFFRFQDSISTQDGE